MRDDRFLRVGPRLRAEAAAHVFADYPNGVLGQPQKSSKVLSRVIVRLGREPNLQQLTFVVEIGDGPAGLKGDGSLPSEPKASAGAMGGSLQRARGIALVVLELGGDIPAPLRMEQRRPLRRRAFDVGDRRHRSIFDVNQ